MSTQVGQTFDLFPAAARAARPIDTTVQGHFRSPRQDSNARNSNARNSNARNSNARNSNFRNSNARDGRNPRAASQAAVDHLAAARRLQSRLRRAPAHSPEQVRAGQLICRHLRAMLMEQAPVPDARSGRVVQPG